MVPAVVAAAVGLGLLIGLTLGALGGGGSILTVPALVFVLGLSAQQATTASLVIVGVTAAAAAVGHARSGHTRWGRGLLLAALGVPASVLGTRLNTRVDEDVLLLAFAALMVVAAVGMLLRARSGEPPAQQQKPTGSRRGAWVRLALAALGIGFLTGFLGVGGGFVVVPVLVVLLRMPMPVAVGTSLLVISLNSAVALAARAGTGLFEWEVIVPFTAAAVAGSLLGKRVADRVDAGALTRAFGVLLLAVAVYVVVQTVIA